MIKGKKEPLPSVLDQRFAGHHWLRELSYDGHHMQTVVLQWQPNARKWCHSGDVATGRDNRHTWVDVHCTLPSARPLNFTEENKHEQCRTESKRIR